MTDKKLTEMSICKDCFHSYVCEQFNEHRECDNKRCHFANDHFVPADLINRLQAKVEENEDTIQFADKIYKEQVAENKRLVNAVNRLTNRICDLKEKDETRHKVFETKCKELEIAKAENERLKEANNSFTDIGKLYSEIKAESYKEFAERLKENSIATFSFKGVVMVEEIDDLLKELVGDSNES